MKVKYVGMFDSAWVPEMNPPFGLEVQRGQTVDVDDELGKRLLEQATNWAAPGAKAKASSPSSVGGDTSE